VPIDLACPRCRSGLRADDADLECPGCGARYPVVGDVPLLTDQAMSEQHRMQRAYFDAEFSHYAAYRLENWRRSFVERIFQALGIEQGRGPYLDVGVGGSGATVIEAARLGVEATGCDLSMEGVLAARRFAVDQGVGERAQFVAAPAEALPFADRSFAAASAGRCPRAPGQRRRRGQRDRPRASAERAGLDHRAARVQVHPAASLAGLLVA
jgi:uncharacterized protein YbaR (Trm112 family)